MAAAAAEVNLSIDESKKVNNFLDDSDIKSVTAGDTEYTPAMRFEDLNISPELLKGLYVEMKFERPSKIQSVSLPMILTPPFRDLIAKAHSGSGKTTCSVLGILSRVDPNLPYPQALCICPTRELAIQNKQVLLKMGKFTGITSKLGVPVDTTESGVALTAQVIIGIPGTIKKWIVNRNLNMSNLKIVVFDEADRMLTKSGYKEVSLRIMKYIVSYSPECQVLLFSATFNDTVKAFEMNVVKDLFVHEYNQLFVQEEELSLDSVKQYKVKVPNELSKIMVIKYKILKLSQKAGQTIIFVRKRTTAGILHEELSKNGCKATTIEGALNQQDRDKIVKKFNDGLTRVLISTDPLARGFDQSQVNLVVNFDLPTKHYYPSEPDYEVYLHWIGRVGRFWRKGAIFNLLCGDRNARIMDKIERHFNHYVTEVPSWDCDEQFEDALKKAGLV